MLWLMMIILFVLFALNFPMFISMIVASMAVLEVFFPNVNPYLANQQLIAGVSTQVLLAVPMFILAADIMTTGQTSNRLLDFVDAFVGHIHGGMAITTAATCTLFGAISGSTQATVVAIGKPMRNRLINSGYEEEDTTALIISSAIIALLIPPSISMIMYCVVTGTSVGDLFKAGVLPGVMILLIFSLYNYLKARKKSIPLRKKMNWRERLEALKNSAGALGFPVVIFAGIYSGAFSPTEGAAMGVLYASIMELFVYKSIKVKDFKEIALSTAVVTTAVFILVAAGNLFSWVISYAKLPQTIATAVLGTDPSALKILIITTIAFFIAGMFVDSIVAIVILTPIFYGPAVAAGIHPIQLGVIVTLEAAIASISPPFGCNIFTATAVWDTPFLKVVKRLPIYLIMLAIVSILIILIPEISLILVN